MKDMRGSRRELPFLNFKPTIFGILIAFALAVFAGPSAQAQFPSDNLQDLISNDGSLVVGDKLFNDFSVTMGGSFLGSLAASNITVTGMQDGYGYGIQITGPLAAGGSIADLTLGYDVSIVTNLPLSISEVHMLFDGALIPGDANGFAEVTETVTTNGLFVGQLGVYVSATATQMEDSLAITPPNRMVMLSKNVELYAQVGSYSTISTIDQTFSQVMVPEPSALALCIAGLSGLVFLRRRSRSSR